MQIKEDTSPFAHMFYMKLSDTSEELVTRFVDACKQYLSGYKGQSHFSIGYRALEINRRVSATNYEIAVNMIFHNVDAYHNYKHHPDYQIFITEIAGMTIDRIVYDSYIIVPDSKDKQDWKK